MNSQFTSVKLKVSNSLVYTKVYTATLHLVGYSLQSRIGEILANTLGYTIHYHENGQRS